MAQKRKYTKVNLEWATKEKTDVVAVPHPKGKWSIGDEVRSLFKNNGKNYSKKD